MREIKEETNLDCKVGDLAIAIQHDYPYKRTVQMIMYLDDVKGEVKISDEHTDARYAPIDEIKTLTLSGCLEKVLKKRIIGFRVFHLKLLQTRQFLLW